MPPMQFLLLTEECSSQEAFLMWQFGLFKSNFQIRGIISQCVRFLVCTQRAFTAVKFRFFLFRVVTSSKCNL